MAKYLKVDNDNLIIDCISKPYSGYVEYPGIVPADILARCYRLIGGVITEVPSLRPASVMDIRETRIVATELKTKVTELAEQAPGNVNIVQHNITTTVPDEVKILTVPTQAEQRRAPVNILKFIPDVFSKTDIIADFNNGDAEDFMPNENVEFDGEMKLKTKMTITPTVLSSTVEGKILKYPIDSSKVKSIKNIRILE